ncbi:MAG: 3-isopropylmalate dehydratase small subunit [Aureispira sp.]|nr:3-isopropylmalate dehydratase small subunit [Aureispira sp.]
MKIIDKINSTAIPLPLENVDTDQIIPARFLKAIDQIGFGEKLFYDWRYLDDQVVNPDFVLNNPIFEGGILIAGRNFGCGSSREHAAWALAGYGIKAVISSHFADIFKGNALNNGILPIEVSDQQLNEFIQRVYDVPSTVFSIDLKQQTLSIEQDFSMEFEIDSYKKICLLNGFSDLDYLLKLNSEISAFEAITI